MALYGSIGAYARSVSRVPGRLQRAARLAATEKARVVGGEARRIVSSRIYAIPVKRRKNGKPEWSRSRNLIEGEGAVADGLDVIFVNDRSSAGAVAGRHQLGADRDPALTKAGVPRQVRPPQQSVQWRPLALKNTRGRCLSITAKRLLDGVAGRI